jgi:hypothetical protein
MTFETVAAELAAQVRDSASGFLTMRRDALRAAFDIGRFTQAQATAVCEALGEAHVAVYPHPFENVSTVRLYDKMSPIGQVAAAILHPEELPETKIRHAADLFEREARGRDLRSDDAPWLRVFDLFLQIALGREPDDWEELRDDRPGPELAREIASALGFEASIAQEPTTLRIAAGVCAFRPRVRRWSAAEFDVEAGSAASGLVDRIAAANAQLGELHADLLRQAAMLLLGKRGIPRHNVELGVLGLRYRREDAERS